MIALRSASSVRIAAGNKCLTTMATSQRGTALPSYATVSNEEPSGPARSAPTQSQEPQPGIRGPMAMIVAGLFDMATLSGRRERLIPPSATTLLDDTGGIVAGRPHRWPHDTIYQKDFGDGTTRAFRWNRT